MPRLTKQITTEVSLSYDIWNENPENPLVIFLHGFGQVQERVFENKKRRIPFTAMVNSEHRADFSYVVPYIDKLEKWDPYKIQALVEHLVENRGFDSNKIILMGHSWGARGCWDIATKFPGLFKAVVAISGVGTPLLGSLLRNTATLAIHGKDDQVVPSTHSSDMHWHIKGDLDNEIMHQVFILKGFQHNICQGCLRDEYIWSWIKKVLEIQEDGNSIHIQRKNKVRQ